ncbi:MAG: hypothetical protein BRD50_04335 [Bacteroidetes bacterium SW_11_45_7]|nr:MAG: hypothetical protein BRD50_04335 [Bacteroidetes bacterium SW_11_45_7]
MVNNSDDQGKIYIRFVVDKDGKLINISLPKPYSLSLDSTTVAYICNMPKWEPGKRNGDPVRVKQLIPVRVK